MLAVLRIPIDADRLYTNDDPTYLIWVRAVVRRTAEMLREAHQRAK